MAQRYFVCRAYIKYKGKLYTKGELLPKTFTHHDKARNVYNSRIGLCEVEEEFAEDSLKVPSPITEPLSGIGNADEVKENLPLDVLPVTDVIEVPETVAPAADEAPKFFFNLPTGTPT